MSEVLLKQVLGSELTEELSQDPQINNCARIAEALDLPDISLSSMIGGVLREQNEEFELQRRKVKAEKSQLQSQETMEMISRMQEKVEQVEVALEETTPTISEVTTALSAQVSCLKQKQKEESSSISTTEQQEPVITHSEVVELARELEQIEKETKETEEILESFSDLPPDITLARLKLESARRQLSEIDSQLSDHLFDFH